MKRAILLFALFGFAFSGRLESKYLPANKQSFAGNQQSYTGQSSFYSGSQQQFSGNQYSGAQHSGPINQAANDVPIIRLDNNNDGETYNYAVETGDGVSLQEEGDARGDGTRAHGGFSYTAPDGQQIQIQYAADENGFQPQGSHLPTAPPVPEEILRAVEQNEADEARGVFDDGQYREDGAGQYSYDSAGQYNGGGAAGYLKNGAAAGSYNNGGAGGSYSNGGAAGSYNNGAAAGAYSNGAAGGSYNNGGAAGAYNNGGAAGSYNSGAAAGAYNSGAAAGSYNNGAAASSYRKYNAGSSAQYSAGSSGKYNSGHAQQSNQNGYKY